MQTLQSKRPFVSDWGPYDPDLSAADVLRSHSGRWKSKSHLLETKPIKIIKQMMGQTTKINKHELANIHTTQSPPIIYGEITIFFWTNRRRNSPACGLLSSLMVTAKETWFLQTGLKKWWLLGGSEE